MKKVIAIILAAAALLSLAACGASAPTASNCTCGGDASACTCCGNCCGTGNQQSVTAAPTSAASASDFDFRLVGSWALTEENIKGALANIKTKNVPSGMNIYFGVDGGVSGEVFDALERSLKITLSGNNNVFDPIGRVKAADGSMDISAIVPADSGITVKKVTYTISDAAKGSFKANTHDAMFAANADDKLSMNISATIDSGILSGDIEVALTFERIYPYWSYSSDGSKGKYLLMDALNGEWKDDLGRTWRFTLDIKGSATATVLNFTMTDAQGTEYVGTDFFDTEGSGGLGTNLTFVFDGMTINGSLDSFNGSVMKITTDKGDSFTMTKVK